MQLRLRLGLLATTILLAHVKGDPEKSRVSRNEPYCKIESPTLFCDYRNTNMVVDMKTLNVSSAEKIFIHNARELLLHTSTCVSLALHNITKVIVNDSEGELCPAPVELSAKFSSLNSIPVHISKLYLEESKVDDISTDTTLSKLTVIDSTVGLVNISSSFAEGTSFILQGSTVSSIENLIVRNNSNVRFYKSYIKNIVEGGLEILGGGKVYLKNSTIKKTEKDAILLSHDGSMFLEDFSGSINVKGSNGYLDFGYNEMFTTRITQVGSTENLRPCECDSQRNYYVAFVTFVIFFVIAFFFNIIIVSMYIKMIRNLPKNCNRKSQETSDILMCDHVIDKANQRHPFIEVKYSAEIEDNSLCEISFDDAIDVCDTTENPTQNSYEKRSAEEISGSHVNLEHLINMESKLKEMEVKLDAVRQAESIIDSSMITHINDIKTKFNDSSQSTLERLKREVNVHEKLARGKVDKSGLNLAKAALQFSQHVKETASTYLNERQKLGIYQNDVLHNEKRLDAYSKITSSIFSLWQELQSTIKTLKIPDDSLQALHDCCLTYFKLEYQKYGSASIFDVANFNLEYPNEKLEVHIETLLNLMEEYFVKKQQHNKEEIERILSDIKKFNLDILPLVRFIENKRYYQSRYINCLDELNSATLKLLMRITALIQIVKEDGVDENSMLSTEQKFSEDDVEQNEV